MALTEVAIRAARPSRKDAAKAKAAKLRDYPSQEQIRAALAARPAETVIERRNRALLTFAILTGMRDRAVASLSPRDLDLAKSPPLVRPQSRPREHRHHLQQLWPDRPAPAGRGDRGDGWGKAAKRGAGAGNGGIVRAPWRMAWRRSPAPLLTRPDLDFIRPSAGIGTTRRPSVLHGANNANDGPATQRRASRQAHRAGRFRWQRPVARGAAMERAHLHGSEGRAGDARPSPARARTRWLGGSPQPAGEAPHGGSGND